MGNAIDIAAVGALVGDPARANMLAALVDGGALPASDLAYAAGVSPQTASWHLGNLAEGGLLAVERRGRHRYYRLASPLVARMLETVMTVAATGRPRYRPRSRLDDAMRAARTCYDHLAGRLGVALADALQEHRQIVLTEDGGRVTEAGARLLDEFGVDLARFGARRTFCRPCLDWSERRPHLAGIVGAALAARAFELGWVRRLPEGRAVAVTPAGRRGFAERFGIEVAPPS